MAEQNTTVELFYSDQWNTALVRERDPQRIVRGLRNETGGPVPATATLTLDGSADSYNPYDAASAIYGLVGRNTPIRIGWEPRYTSGTWADARATFPDTSTGGWLPADVGGVWTMSGLGGSVVIGDWTQSGGWGRMYVPDASAYRQSLLNLAVEDCTQEVTFRCPQATGANLEPANLIFRGTTTTGQILVRVQITTGNAVQLVIYSADSTTLGSGTVSGLSHAGTGTPLKVKARTVGRDIFAKVWDPAGAEPSTWHLRVTDTTTAPIPGWVGIRSGRAASNTNTTNPQFEYDNYAVTVNVPRFVGEVASWKPGRAVIDPLKTPGRGDRWCEIEAAGIMRRLSQRASPLRSALYRGLSQDPNVVAFWPMEDGASASAIAEVRGGGSAGRFSGITLGTDPGDLVGAGSVAAFSSTGLMHLPITASVTEWSVSFMVRFPQTPGGYFGFAQVLTTDQNWFLDIDATSFTFEVYDNASGSLLDTVTSAYGSGAEPPNWLVIQLHAVQSGGNINWEVKWNPVGSGTFYWTTVQSFADTLTRPVLFIGVGGAEPEMGSVVVSSGSGLDITDLASLATGWAGELAETRMSRLCTEQGVTFVLDGTAGDTPPMSGQTPKTFVSLPTEGAFADQGILYEPRSHLGFALRTARSLYNQTAVLALDMDTEGIAPPLYPVVDDLPTENDVTAKRPRGSEARSVLESGRMSVLDPPDGVGRTAVEYDAAVASDLLLPAWAQWRRHLGTVDEARYPQVTVDLDAVPSLAQAASTVDVGDVITIDHLENQPTLSLLVLGYTETFGTHRRQITYTCAPASPYVIGELNHATRGYLGSDATEVWEAFDSGTDTALHVLVGAGRPLWLPGTTDLDIMASGVRLTCTDIDPYFLDQFGRTESNGWGNGWTNSGGSASDYSVSSGLGRISLGSLNVSRRLTRALTLADGELLAKFTIPWASTGDDIETTIMFRYQDSTNYYQASIFWDGDATFLEMRLIARVAGVATTLGTQTFPFTQTGSGLSAWLRARFHGSTLMARGWAANAATEQTDNRSLVATDTTFTSGLIGVRCNLQPSYSGTVPAVVTVDDFTVVNPQTLTVDLTPVNGVSKTIPVGDAVDVAEPAYIGL